MEKKFQKTREINKRETVKTKGLCPLAKKCGGCDFQGVPYEKQLQEKQNRVEELLGEFGKPMPILGMEDPKYYRNKVHHVFSLDMKGHPAHGIYEERSHNLLQTEECILEDEMGQAIIQTIFSLLRSFKITVYDEDSDYGLLRHVLVRRGFTSGEVMVVLVVTSPIFPSKNNFVKALRAKHPEITTVVLNVNDKNTSMVLGGRNIPLYGPGFIFDMLAGCRFRISPDSFYQINPVQTEKLYKTAIDFAGLSGAETVLDTYCGIGTIGLAAASEAGRIIGAELNPNAVKDAVSNAKANKIENATFVCMDATKFMVEAAAKGDKVDVVFMDPPRSGSTEEFVNAVGKLAPKRVVYVSCDPETQARDLTWFKKIHYNVEKIQPVDMFPFTKHVECVVLLSKLI